MKQDADIVIKFQADQMNDEYYMQEALKEAKKAVQKNEVPVGCVIVYNDEIIARSHNTRHKEKSVFDHAEILAIKKASKKLNAWILEDTIIYITLEPCLMCAGAILQSRIKKVVFAANEPKHGACGSVINVFDKDLYHFNHQVEVVPHILEEESKQLLKSFFQELRNLKKQNAIN